MQTSQKLIEHGYGEIQYLSGFSFDSALIGITDDNRAVYDYDKMVAWLVNEENFIREDADEWINCNTIPALGYLGAKAPIIMYALS